MSTEEERYSPENEPVEAYQVPEPDVHPVVLLIGSVISELFQMTYRILKSMASVRPGDKRQTFDELSPSDKLFRATFLICGVLTAIVFTGQTLAILHLHIYSWSVLRPAQAFIIVAVSSLLFGYVLEQYLSALLSEIIKSSGEFVFPVRIPIYTGVLVSTLTVSAVTAIQYVFRFNLPSLGPASVTSVGGVAAITLFTVFVCALFINCLGLTVGLLRLKYELLLVYRTYMYVPAIVMMTILLLWSWAFLGADAALPFQGGFLSSTVTTIRQVSVLILALSLTAVSLRYYFFMRYHISAPAGDAGPGPDDRGGQKDSTTEVSE